MIFLLIIHRLDESSRIVEYISSHFARGFMGTIANSLPIVSDSIQSGNVGVDKATGQPVVYDPASYYGHNEAE